MAIWLIVPVLRVSTFQFPDWQKRLIDYKGWYFKCIYSRIIEGNMVFWSHWTYLRYQPMGLRDYMKCCLLPPLNKTVDACFIPIPCRIGKNKLVFLYLGLSTSILVLLPSEPILSFSAFIDFFTQLHMNSVYIVNYFHFMLPFFSVLNLKFEPGGRFLPMLVSPGLQRRLISFIAPSREWTDSCSWELNWTFDRVQDLPSPLYSDLLA